jgi:hypothetical protein
MNSEENLEFKTKLDDYLTFAQALMSSNGKPKGTNLAIEGNEGGRGGFRKTIFIGDGFIVNGGS